MALFGKKVVELQPAAEPLVQPSAAPDISAIVTQVLEQVLPALMRAQPQAQPAQQQEQEPDLDPTEVEERERLTRVVTGVVNSVTAPYANVFNRTMPGFARESAVRELSEGQAIIYQRHIKEVDEAVDRACSINPSLKAAPEIHANAISLILGKPNVLAEIEQLVLQRAKPEDLPSFVVPNATGGTGSSVAADAATKEEADWVSFFAPRSRQRSWDVESMRKFKNIKPGTLAEMVAEYKEMQAAEKNT